MNALPRLHGLLGLAALLGLAGVLAAAPHATAAPTPADTPPPVLRVMPLGDSITAGYKSTTGAGYRLPLIQAAAGQDRYRIDLVGTTTSGTIPDPDHEGHNGAFIDDISLKADTWVTAAQPDVILLHLGINDLERSGDKEHAADRMTVLIGQLQTLRPGVTVIVQGLIATTPHLAEPVAAFNQRVKAAVVATREQGGKAVFVEAPPLGAAEMADDLHPNDQGYQLIGERFHQALDAAAADGLAVSLGARRAGFEAGGTHRVRWADLDGDGRADYAAIGDNGSVRALANRGGEGRGGWHDLGQIALGVVKDRARARLADFDGDGRADYITLSASGAVTVYLNQGGDNHGGWRSIGQVALGVTDKPEQVRFTDFDGDGRTDYTVIADNGAVRVFLNRGGDGRGGWSTRGQVASGLTKDRDQVRLSDVDADGRADYILLTGNGAVRVFLNQGGDGHGGWKGADIASAAPTTDGAQVDLADISGDFHADHLTTAEGATTAQLYDNGNWQEYGRLLSDKNWHSAQ
ncbi:FG-GAP-like repeat-containing protein [Streptomyces sp. SP18CS02]|uniref:FG-GAP-like repeat-containing protein n=1 Tax=Streptomyces sp. SP18CS02 TaxID=3002531 RepID=UPI002E77253D|nr:FG-GAP-like repeat-containing protein [Streptomyces sp. SP18CS02]MEE1751213.1 FG-GAP-like repeat-containing protein [Streptomyces sp. SP18CS02]